MVRVALSSALHSPIHFLFAIWQSGESLKILPNNIITYTEWGCPFDDNSFVQLEEKSMIHLVWYSILEDEFYEYKLQLDFTHENKQIDILIGCTSKGMICFWNYELKHSEILLYTKGDLISNTIRTTFNGKDLKIKFSDEETYSFQEFYQLFNIELGKYLPSSEIRMINIDACMKRFTYRYIIHWNEKRKINVTMSETVDVLNSIEEQLYDGTHDKLNDGGLLKYHQAGKPKKLAVKWHIGKSEYSAYFWFEEEPIREVFDKFYGAHPDTKTDFIIRIDAENRKYELALYRYGLKEPQIIPENVYQLLVFKNMFEDYRSDNYNQERGAWIW